MKVAVFWVVAPCSLVEVHQRFRDTYSLQHQGPDDGGSKYFWNVGKLLPDYTALQPRRQPSQYLRRKHSSIPMHISSFFKTESQISHVALPFVGCLIRKGYGTIIWSYTAWVEKESLLKIFRLRTCDLTSLSLLFSFDLHGSRSDSE
jgi:hypothetical protein